jgi:hypothetical protein
MFYKYIKGCKNSKLWAILTGTGECLPLARGLCSMKEPVTQCDFKIGPTAVTWRNIKFKKNGTVIAEGNFKTAQICDFSGACRSPVEAPKGLCCQLVNAQAESAWRRYV